MVNKFSVALYLYSKNKSYSKLLQLATEISGGLAAMTGVYISPFPDLVTFNAQIALLRTKLNSWGDQSNHGTKADLIALQDAVDTVRTSLTQLAQYVMDTTPNDKVSWAAAKFPIKAGGSPIGMLQAVVDFHSVVSPKVQINWLRLKWKRPLGSERARGIKYIIKRSATNDITTAEFIGISSKTFFEYEPPTVTGQYYWCFPISPDGTIGVASNALFASPRQA